MIGKSVDDRPVIVAIAGPNGAGKSTFYAAHISPAGLRFVNADLLARELGLEPYAAAALAQAARMHLRHERESFAFETVLSDPVGEKVEFLRDAAAHGYAVVLCYIGISSPRVCAQRVALRVAKGGHDVPTHKLRERFPRVLSNLRLSIATLPLVLVFDNEDLRRPFRLLACFAHGKVVVRHGPWPRWLRQVESKRSVPGGGTR
jgi:predicted ABC-type ATPase